MLLGYCQGHHSTVKLESRVPVFKAGPAGSHGSMGFRRDLKLVNCKYYVHVSLVKE